MRIVIIGNGIAGVTAARHLRKRSINAERSIREEVNILIVSSETAHFFSRTALMYVYMGHMRYEDTKPYADDFWQKNGIDLRYGRVERIDPVAKLLHFAEGEAEPYDVLILACGSLPNRLQGLAGQDLAGVQGLYSYQDLESLEARTAKINTAVVVGGGLIGVELAEMLLSRGKKVYFLVREEGYWSNVLPKEEADMVSAHLRAHGVELRLQSELAEIIPDSSGREIATVLTKAGERIDCQFLGLTAGVSPNIAWLRAVEGLDLNRGILVDEYLRTSIEDIWAVGDCVELRKPAEGRRPIEAIWYTGRMMGEVAAHNIAAEHNLVRGMLPYDAGIWFNSAKFFDIEYQTYGYVPSAGQVDEKVDSIFWKDAKGERSIRIVYERSENAPVLGFNVLGIRYRQEVCQKWIREKASLHSVLQELSLANFDVEFSKEYENNLRAVYSQKTGKKVESTKLRGLSAVWAWLSGKT